jgi:hypothetical protein
MHGLNCSQFKTPPDCFYAGLRVLLIDIIQVGFLRPQSAGECFSSYNAVGRTDIPVIYSVFIGRGAGS